jgi:hypothetical protein
MRGIMKKYSLIYLFLALFSYSACAGADKKNSDQTGDSSGSSSAGSAADIQDNPFFEEPLKFGESFRILITDNGYAVKQIGLEKRIRLIKDEAGDKEQFSMYKELNEKYNFKAWQFDAMIDLQISPKTGYIEKSNFVPHQMPKTWQAARLFMEDISRYRFEHVNENDPHRTVRVSFRWLISAVPGLSEEEYKRRATEFLKSEQKK